MPDDFPGELISPETLLAMDGDLRPVKPLFVRDDEQGWHVIDTGRWRPDDAGAF